MIVLSSVCLLRACVHSDARDLGSTQGAFQVALSRLHLGTPGVLQRILENDESNDNINGFGAGNEIGRRPFRFYIQLSLHLCQACHDKSYFVSHYANANQYRCSAVTGTTGDESWKRGGKRCDSIEHAREQKRHHRHNRLFLILLRCAPVLAVLSACNVGGNLGCLRCTLCCNVGAYVMMIRFGMLSLPDGTIRYLMGGYNERHDIALGDLHEIPFPPTPAPAVRTLVPVVVVGCFAFVCCLAVFVR